ncbi:MAG: hypothetical protein K2J59_08410 [Eubacterium sp.]|nr:hypothetical protein [Eubacterium sp.]
MANEEIMGLASIGVKVTVGGKDLKQHTSIGDMSNEKDTLDATTMLDEVEKGIDGLIKSGDFEIQGLYNGAEGGDYATLKAIEGTIVPVVVTTPDGITHACTGIPNVSISGVGVNAVINYSAKFKLQSKWVDGTASA